MDLTREAKGAWRKLKHFDLFPKSFDDVKDKTSAGAAVSIIGTLLIIILLFTEFSAYWYPTQIQTIFVDSTRGQKLPVTVDIIFTNLLCDDVRLDVVDDTGEHLQVDLSKIDKKPINAEHELKYPLGGVFPRLFNAPTGPVDGCRLMGSFVVEKAKGNFHVAAGSAHSQQHTDHKHHVHRLRPKDITEMFNISHRIERFYFGPYFPGRNSPLERAEMFETESKSSQMSYILKIVPTMYESGSRKIESYQYSSSAHKQYIDFSQPSFPLPGLFFKWDISPYMIKKTEDNLGFGRFLTRVCAVVGGSFVVLGLIYRTIYKAFEIIKEKGN